MNLIWKLLKQNISKPQLIGFSIANLIGLFIIMLVIQAYNDISPLFQTNNSFFQKDYITISKSFNIIDALSASTVGFTKEEIDDLKAQDFVKSIGTFKNSGFSVYGSINQAGAQFGTEMFFESVPDQFVDVKNENWKYIAGENIIPLILPKNYLDLYNFGFADARNIPKLTESMAKLVTLNVSIYGNGKHGQMKAKIIAFSDRLNTILVPESFIDYANEQYSTKQTNPSRLILEVYNPASPDISKYLTAKHYNTEGDKTSNSRIMSLLVLLVTIVISIGLVICLLSVSIFVLSIYLLIEKNTEKMTRLRLIGYSKKQVCKPYQIMISVINLCILIVACIGVYISQVFYIPVFRSFWPNFNESSLWMSFVLGSIIVFVIWLYNMSVLKRKIK